MVKTTKHKKSSAWIAHKVLKVENGTESTQPTNKSLIKKIFDEARKSEGFMKRSLGIAVGSVALIGCIGLAVVSFIFLPVTAAVAPATSSLVGAFFLRKTLAKTLKTIKRKNIPQIQNEMLKRILSQQKSGFLSKWKNNIRKNKAKKKNNAVSDPFKKAAPKQTPPQPKSRTVTKAPPKP
jgi:hypothetical protein